MILDFKKYFSYAVRDKNLLIYSNLSFKKNESVLTSFKTHTHVNISSVSIDDLKNHILTKDIDVLLIDLNENSSQVYDILSSMSSTNKKVHVILYIKLNCKNLHPPLVNICEGVLAEPFDDDVLMYKLFTSLSFDNAINSVANAQNSIVNIQNESCNMIDNYLDTYEGEILFLSEALKEYVARLDSGELSQELIDSISIDMDKVSKVFSHHFYTKEVSPIFRDFFVYLNKLDLKSIDLKNIEGFDYLARVIEDINSYLIEYFVDRVFSDIHVFKDSLYNSIKFMENRLDSVSDTSSELEFF